MSETVEADITALEAASAPEPTEATEQAVEAPVEAVETEATATEQSAPDDKKQKQGDRRFAHLTARMAAESKARQEAEQRAAAAEALLKARQEGSAEPSQPHSDADAIRAKAEELRAQDRFNERRMAVVSEGTKEFGTEQWNEKTTVLAGLGATENPAFMQALVELPAGDATRLVASLADDADELTALLALPPVAMAAKMGRMAAQITKLAEPVKPKLSEAPRPIAPVTGRPVPAPDISDPKLSMKEYVALRAKQAPRHLGGRGGN